MSRSRRGGRPAGARRDNPSISPDGVSSPKLSSNGKKATASVTSVAPTATPVSPVQPAVQRRFTLKRVLIGIGIVALLLIAGGLGYAYWTVQRAMPTVNGFASLPGLSAPVTVTRDVYGVPHIVANNVQDLYAAQGYVHAQDRLFQMFYYRQLSAGRLAEAFGPAAAEADRFLRTIGMRRAAEAEWQQASTQTRTNLEAYARGVNAFLHTHSDSLPLEFNLIGGKVDDWQPVDTLAFAKVMAWDLSTNWDMELLGADLVAKVGAQRTDQLLPGYPTDGPFIVPGANSGQVNLSPALQSFDAKIRPWLPSAGLAELGSNNWVVDGTKSATGKPLLSNDPHLSVQNPSIWYQIHLSTADGKYDAAGFGFAAVPGIVTGHNNDIAWGVTNVEGDVQDLYIEKLDPQGHPGQYQTADGWKPLQIITETINVKGADPITQTIRMTGHGPLISDALTAISSTLGTTVKEPLAFQWTAARPGHIVDALFKLQQASNWQEFRAALADWSVPGQNFVYADKQGNIGYQMTGQQPIRKKGDGRVPVPGWTGEYDWSGFVPFDDLPRAYNPPEHFVATANNKPFGPDYKYPIQGEWAAPWRISRIEDMLKAKDKFSIDDFKTMVMDTHSLMAKKIAPVLAGLKPSDARAQPAAQMLGAWDANVAANSAAAAIYEVTVQDALSETFYDELGSDLFSEYLDSAGRSSWRALELLVDKPDDPLWDRTDTQPKENRDTILARALTDAVTELTADLGTDMTTWTWGNFHTITPRHTFGSQPVVSGVFNLSSLPLGGDGATVSVAGYDSSLPYALAEQGENPLAGYDVRAYQSYRMIIDLSDWSKAVAIFGTGESGQPYNKHWGDMYTAWQQGQFDPMLYTKDQIAANKDGVLTLNP